MPLQRPLRALLRSAVGVGLAATLVLAAALGVAGCTQAATPPRQTEPAPPATSERTAPPPETVEFAVIGDYGTDDEHENAVARLVASWRPDYVVATGDDYYAVAGVKGEGKYETSTGKYYAAWLPDPEGTDAASRRNAFFPAMGNHDYADATPSPETYLDFFELPGEGYSNSSGNERYYDFVEGPVHFFVLNSNPEEPDGTSNDSTQAEWLKAQLAASTSPFDIVVAHHPPYSSDETHGSTEYMQWPFSKWGAEAMFSGHAHAYERIERDGVVYFVDGLGGAARYGFGDPVKGSKRRFSDDWGAMKVRVTETALTFEFYDLNGRRIDSFELRSKR